MRYRIKAYSPLPKTSRGNTWMVGQSNYENAVGFCHHAKHVGYLNERLLKQHDCLGKQCKFLERYRYRSFWIKRDIISALKKKSKNACGSVYVNSVKMEKDNVNHILTYCLKQLIETGTVPVIEFKE